MYLTLKNVEKVYGEGENAVKVLIGMAAYFAVNAVHIRRVRRIKMADALKNRE